jgi:hypothetical protein
LRDKIRAAVRNHKVSAFVGLPLPPTALELEDRIMGIMASQERLNLISALYTDLAYGKARERVQKKMNRRMFVDKNGKPLCFV